MNIESTIDDLTRYNAWRRGDDDIEQPDPTQLGFLLEDAIGLLGEYRESLGDAIGDD